MMVRSTVLVACVLVSACGGQSKEPPKPASETAATSPSQAGPALTITPLTLPASVGTEPQLSVSTKGTIFSWVEQNGPSATLKFAERSNGQWTPARTVATGKDWFVTDADLPTVQRLANGTLVAAWHRSTDVQAEAYDTWIAYSTNDGMSWSKPFKPYADKTKTQHGFVSLFDQPGGGLGLVWLDAREWELNQDAPDGGSVMLRSASFDSSWKQTSDQVANLRVCDCCQTSVATTADGVVVAFRDRSDADIRDIHVSRLESGKWTTPQVVHQDNWELDSCPVNGPAISAHDRTVAVAWFTGVGGQGHSYLAFSQDAGRTFGNPVRLDEQQSTGRVDVELLDDGSAVATWVEFANQQGQLKARQVSADGRASAPLAVQASSEGRASGFPRMVRQQNELVFVWGESAGGEHAEHAGAEGVQMKGAVARLR
jgi:hypothetical protein